MKDALEIRFAEQPLLAKSERSVHNVLENTIKFRSFYVLNVGR